MLVLFNQQVNGYKGVDFSSEKLTQETFSFACRCENISQHTMWRLYFLKTRTCLHNLSWANVVRTLSSELLKTGTAAFLPTVITATINTYKHVLPIIADYLDKADDFVKVRVWQTNLFWPDRTAMWHFKISETRAWHPLGGTVHIPRTRSGARLHCAHMHGPHILN